LEWFSGNSTQGHNSKIHGVDTVSSSPKFAKIGQLSSHIAKDHGKNKDAEKIFTMQIDYG